MKKNQYIEPKLPDWVYKLIDSLAAEINLLRDQNKKLKDENNKRGKTA